MTRSNSASGFCVLCHLLRVCLQRWSFALDLNFDLHLAQSTLRSEMALKIFLYQFFLFSLVLIYFH